MKLLTRCCCFLRCNCNKSTSKHKIHISGVAWSGEQGVGVVKEDDEDEDIVEVEVDCAFRLLETKEERESKGNKNRLYSQFKVKWKSSTTICAICNITPMIFLFPLLVAYLMILYNTTFVCSVCLFPSLELRFASSFCRSPPLVDLFCYCWRVCCVILVLFRDDVCGASVCALVWCFSVSRPTGPPLITAWMRLCVLKYVIFECICICVLLLWSTLALSTE